MAAPSRAGVFRLNSAPMTSSLFEPNTALLERYNGIEELCRVVSREDVTTSTLDSLRSEMGPIDWLKVDVQGGELAVIEGATELLKSVVYIYPLRPSLALCTLFWERLLLLLQADKPCMCVLSSPHPRCYAVAGGGGGRG